MFIPRGKAIHENLATSFVLLEALVEDLCEGGFSGAVEITLRDTDGHVIIDRGKLAAAIERREGGGYSRTSVAELAAMSRRERGRVSVYGFSEGVASAIASRFLAQPLYTNLSTDFADLEKMLMKLSRERDRQWFVEITVAGGKVTLIHLMDDRCRIVTEEAESPGSDRDGLDPSENRALGDLLSEVNRQGGMFDVYFARLDAAADSAETLGPEEKLPELRADEPEPSTTQHAAPAMPVTEDPPRAPFDEDAHTPFQTPEPASTAGEPDKPDEIELGADASESAPDPTPPASAGRAASLPRSGALKDAEAMVEIKRLMGEIARTIEVSTQAIEQRDSFSMYLRTGQLKIADRYPFLDPFGAEFEYLGGEIAFVGRAKPEEFIAGLTEALRLAVVGVAESSLQTSRLRARIAEDLRGLLDRNRAELERYGLDGSIQEIVG
ncbi:MAG TPA: hypothetical protein VE262_09915 [Blastocatellia bacterium]|nr:hypothetical protein [Blastocatellia bacterium]